MNASGYGILSLTTGAVEGAATRPRGGELLAVLDGGRALVTTGDSLALVDPRRGATIELAATDLSGIVRSAIRRVVDGEEHIYALRALGGRRHDIVELTIR